MKGSGFVQITIDPDPGGPKTNGSGTLLVGINQLVRHQKAWFYFLFRFSKLYVLLLYCTGTSVSWPVLSFPSPERWSQPLLPCLASVTEEPPASSSSSHPLEDNSSLPMTEDGYLGNYEYSFFMPLCENGWADSEQTSQKAFRSGSDWGLGCKIM